MMERYFFRVLIWDFFKQVLPLGIFFCYSIIALTITSMNAYAGSYMVSPVRIFMKPKDRVFAVTLRNEGDSEVFLQADIHIWTQKKDGTDELTITDDLILSPPIIKLPPFGTQVVRLARLLPPDLSKQLTYRLIIREVPEINPKQGINIPIALAFSIPVFITPATAAQQIDCDFSKLTNRTGLLSCGNNGNAYAQTRELTLKFGESDPIILKGGSYILPSANKSMTYKSEQDIASGMANLVVNFDNGKTISKLIDVK